MDDSPDEIPIFAELAADPEIAALLDFEPVPRKIEVAGGWTPAVQRDFIARLAVHGSPTKACEELGKNRTGINKLYRSPLGASFRDAWDRAIVLAKRRQAEQGPAAAFVRAGTKPPTLDNRRRHDPPPDHQRGGGFGENDPDPDEAQKWELIHSIGVKFMRKVAAERAARLNGEIVAADFYLRQITFVEVTLDLAAAAFGWNARRTLAKLRRGKHGIMDIASTELTDWLDGARRLWWAQEGDPERPPHPDVRFLDPHWSAEGAYAANVDQHTTGALTPPARGFSREAWAEMSTNEQRAARQAQFAEDAVEQAAWERRAIAEYNARSRSDE